MTKRKLKDEMANFDAEYEWCERDPAFGFRSWNESPVYLMLVKKNGGYDLRKKQEK